MRNDKGNLNRNHTRSVTQKPARRLEYTRLSLINMTSQVTICRNEEQRQGHVIATTTGQPAQHSPWNTNANCPELLWQQSMFRDKDIFSDEAATNEFPHVVLEAVGWSLPATFSSTRWRFSVRWKSAIPGEQMSDGVAKKQTKLTTRSAYYGFK